MEAVKLSHAVWLKVAAFLDWADHFSLLTLNSDVVDSPLRLQFFSQAAWCVPPTAPQADRVVRRLTVKRSVRRVKISYKWQQAYLVEFPELEHVAINPMTEGDDEGDDEEDDDREDDGRQLDFELSSTIPTTVKRLSLDWFDGVPSLSALARLVNLEELVLDVVTVRDGSALLSLPKLTRLSLSLRGDAEVTDYAFLSRLRHLRTLSVAIPEVNTGTFPVLSPLEDVEIMYGTGTVSVDLLVQVGPQLKRLTFGASMPFTITARLGTALTRIEELNLRDVHFGTSQRELAVLSRLTTLKKLYFPVEAKLSSLAPLLTLTQLEELEVGARAKADWSPLLGMQRLQYLNQWGDATKKNESSMRTLSRLPLLTTLMVPTKLLSRFPLPQVKKMELWNESEAVLVFDRGCCVNVTDLKMYGPFSLPSLVQCFPNLEDLKIVEWLPAVGVGPSPLTRLTRLKHLSVLADSTNHRKLAFLSELSGIQTLVLQSIGDLSLLRNMKNQLRELTLQSVPSGNISILAELTQLRKLNLERCNVRSLACLRGHPSLMELRLPSTANYQELVNTDGECSLPNLKGIWLWSKRVF